MPLPGDNRRWLKDEFALFYTCRQIYAEASLVLLETQTLSFGSPGILYRFLRSNQRGPLNAIRSVQLEMSIECREDESYWNRVLALMPHTLTGLQQIHIYMCQKAVGWNVAPKYTAAGDLFLKEIYGLRRLGLRTAVVLVTDHSVGEHREGPLGGATWLEHVRWTQTQKLQWARYVEAIILARDTGLKREESGCYLARAK